MQIVITATINILLFNFITLELEKSRYMAIPDENNANTEQFWKSEVQRLEKELMHAKQKYNEAKVKDKKREFIMNRLEIIRSMKKRAIYKCRKCGLPKKGHVCVYTK